MKIIDINDEDYPEQLRKIKKPPQKLYVLGNEKILKEKSIAIVGSRNCTEQGEESARKFSQKLTEQGLVITSGMANGIDTFAHKGCLEENGKTIAVLGCGFNHIFPKENKSLFYKIIDSGGAVVSEYPPYISASSEQFRKRNRIVSGLSIATLIIEAAYRSGTSITARYTYEQNKPVFCIPNSLDNNKGVGTNELLKKGAILVTNIEDILDYCNIEKKEIIKHTTDKKIKLKEVKNNSLTIKNVKKEYKEIYNILSEIPTNSNEIYKKTKIPINEINSKLLLMEMEGLVKRLSGNEYLKI
jgi:DNA processing protein